MHYEEYYQTWNPNFLADYWYIPNLHFSEYEYEVTIISWDELWEWIAFLSVPKVIVSCANEDVGRVRITTLTCFDFEDGMMLMGSDAVAIDIKKYDAGNWSESSLELTSWCNCHEICYGFSYWILLVLYMN